jgi:hypothetical protein
MQLPRETTQRQTNRRGAVEERAGGRRAYLSGGDGELAVEEEERRGGDVQAEEGAAVPEAQPHRRVHGHHLRRHARPVRPALDVVRLEHHALRRHRHKRT